LEKPHLTPLSAFLVELGAPMMVATSKIDAHEAAQGGAVVEGFLAGFVGQV